MSRGEDFDRSDFDLDAESSSTRPAGAALADSGGSTRDLSVLADVAPTWMWPINPALITSVGDSVVAKRPQKNRPHDGLDIYAPAGTRIYAASAGRVLRIRDGRASKHKQSRAAGLFVDVLSDPDPVGRQYIQRYLHLGNVRDLDKQALAIGTPIGELAQPHTSGLAEHSHLHFEVRAVRTEGAYGPPLDPLRFLPPRNVT